jgi:flagellin-like protein
MATLGSKAITPIIAVILLLMMVVAAAGAAFYWLSRIQGQMQGGVESYQSQLFERMAGQVDVIAADYREGTSGAVPHNLTIFLQNTGNIKVPLNNGTSYPTTIWILKDPDQNVVCSTDWSSTSTSATCDTGCGVSTNLDIGEIKQIRLRLNSSSCAINATSYATGSVFSFTIDFSGKATTAGSFTK